MSHSRYTLTVDHDGMDVAELDDALRKALDGFTFDDKHRWSFQVWSDYPDTRIVAHTAYVPASESGRCNDCFLYGILSCRESVGVCDLCGQRKDVFMDYSKSGDREKPDETVCLDCLDNGGHIKAAHTEGD